MSEAQNKVRSKKIEQLLTKVKKATQASPKVEAPLAIGAPQPEKKADTFMTACGTVPQTDEDLTDEALMRQYEELAAKGEIKSK